MNCKKPEFKTENEIIVCKKESCPHCIKEKFISNRTQMEFEFTGCPELLQLFYLKEIWYRMIGNQAATESLRNETTKAIGGLANVINNASTLAYQRWKEQELLEGRKVKAIEGGEN